MRQYEVIHPGLVTTSLADSEGRPLDLKARAHAAFRDVPSTRAQVAVGLIYRILACTTERDFNVKFFVTLPDEVLPKQLDRSERPQKNVVFCVYGTVCLLLACMLDLVGVGFLNLFGGDQCDLADRLHRWAQIPNVPVIPIFPAL